MSTRFPNSIEADIQANAGSIGTTEIASNAITTAKITDANVTYAKIQNISASGVLLGRKTAGTGVTEEITPAGDVTLSGSTFTIANDAVTTAKVINDAVTYAKIQNVSATNRLLGRSTAGAGDVEEITVAGDISQSGSTFTIAAGAVTNAKTADTTGAAGLALRKSAIVVYDFAVDGGSAGVIALTGAPTIPDNAVVWVESYEVVTTLTSAGDTATVTLTMPTDGDLMTAIAINDASNPWDAGAYVMGTKALVAANETPKKLTAARVPTITVGVQNLTAGKIVFQLAYWVSV